MSFQLIDECIYRFQNWKHFPKVVVQIKRLCWWTASLFEVSVVELCNKCDYSHSFTRSHSRLHASAQLSAKICISLNCLQTRLCHLFFCKCVKTDLENQQWKELHNHSDETLCFWTRPHLVIINFAQVKITDRHRLKIGNRYLQA